MTHIYYKHLTMITTTTAHSTTVCPHQYFCQKWALIVSNSPVITLTIHLEIQEILRQIFHCTLAETSGFWDTNQTQSYWLHWSKNSKRPCSLARVYTAVIEPIFQWVPTKINTHKGRIHVFHGASNRHRPFLYPAAITSALFPNRWIPPRLQLTAKDIIDALCT